MSLFILWFTPMHSEVPAVPFVFHGTAMTVRLSTESVGGAYCVIEMTHPAKVGPSLHVHPTHSESFVVLDGAYTFWINGRQVDAKIGDAVVVRAGEPHRYLSGPNGGRVIVISPPHLEKYFYNVAQAEQTRDVALDEESAIASRYGQHFLEMQGHWGIKSADT